MKRYQTLRFAVFLSLTAFSIIAVLQPAAASNPGLNSNPGAIQTQPQFQQTPAIWFYWGGYSGIWLPNPFCWMLTGNNSWKPNSHDLFNLDPDPRDAIRNCGGDDGFAPSLIKKP
jgi:hypothetical protein